jgi:hypothetical protein
MEVVSAWLSGCVAVSGPAALPSVAAWSRSFLKSERLILVDLPLRAAMAAHLPGLQVEYSSVCGAYAFGNRAANRSSIDAQLRGGLLRIQADDLHGCLAVRNRSVVLGFSLLRLSVVVRHASSLTSVLGSPSTSLRCKMGLRSGFRARVTAELADRVLALDV